MYTKKEKNNIKIKFHKKAVKTKKKYIKGKRKNMQKEKICSQINESVIKLMVLCKLA